MNDEITNCESRAEAISLLAAGCLTSQEEQDLRQHLVACATCRERFEQMVSVCSGLRLALPSPGTFDVSALVSRTMADVSSKSDSTRAADTPAKEHRWQTKSNRLARRWLVASVACLLTLMSGIAWRSFVGTTTDPQELVRDAPPRIEPDEQPPLEIATSQPPSSGMATLIELRRSFAESDEAFEALLARNSRAMFSQPLKSQTLFQDSL
jgi:hypothetical protein